MVGRTEPAGQPRDNLRVATVRQTARLGGSYRPGCVRPAVVGRWQRGDAAGRGPRHGGLGRCRLRRRRRYAAASASDAVGEWLIKVFDADDRPGDDRAQTVSRRSLLWGGTALGAAAAAGVGGYAIGRRVDGDQTASQDNPSAIPPSTPSRGDSVEAAGSTQAGVVRPANPQQHGLFSSVDADIDSATELRGLLASLGETVLAVAAPGARVPGVTDEGAGDLTVMIGLGPRLVAMVGTDLPGSHALPRFTRDGQLTERSRGGDLLIAVQASDPAVLDPVRAGLVASLRELSARWQQQGFRGVGNGQPGVARNVVGYLDGIVIPRTQTELDTNVWIADGPAQHGTICVLRRLRVDVDRFRAETIGRQDEIIGRHRSDGSPLSGGGPMAQVDLQAKTVDGTYLTPARSHARAAHPSFTGSATMLRGSYTFSENTGSSGLLFRCFQPDLDTFVRTQQRLDEVDDLMGYTTLTATGSFLVLPGFDADRPLGSSLFA